MKGEAPAPPADEGFETSLEAALPGLRSFAARLRAADADDLVQETLRRAWQHRTSRDQGRPMLPWLRRIALRVAIDRGRARFPLPLSAEPETPGPPPDTVMEQREHVKRLLEQVGEPARSLLIQFHGQGATIDELARRFRLPVGTVKSHLHRARRQLAERSRGEDET